MRCVSSRICDASRPLRPDLRPHAAVRHRRSGLRTHQGVTGGIGVFDLRQSRFNPLPGKRQQQPLGRRRRGGRGIRAHRELDPARRIYAPGFFRQELPLGEWNSSDSFLQYWLPRQFDRHGGHRPRRRELQVVVSEQGSMMKLVMAGLVPAIHVFTTGRKKGVDARHKAGHDGKRIGQLESPEDAGYILVLR
jgi:hypothetical protein